MNPKVFVSHAGEDKERFVLDFGTKLRAKGIDAWVAEWEMGPGDSLVKRIFDEGIGNAEAFVVVLSRHSVHKPWVCAELDVGVVRRIEGSTRLIPVVIDDCEIPVSLQGTLYERIHDTNNYARALDRIVAKIVGRTDKPPLGPVPAYAQANVFPVLDLSPMDSLVFKLVCDTAVDEGDRHPSSASVWERAKALGIPEEAFYESLDVFARRRLIKPHHTNAHRIEFFVIGISGFEEYATKYIPNYGSMRKAIIAQIVNEGRLENLQIQEATGYPLRIVDHVIEFLAGRRKLVQLKYMDVIRVANPSPELRRMLD